MDEAMLAERIGSRPGGSFQVNHIAFERWGNELNIECVYEPGNGLPAIPFHVLLHDCREMHWRIYVHLRPEEDQTLPVASLVNIHLGRDNHRKPLNLLTDFFGLTVAYGILTVKVDGSEEPPVIG